MHDRFRDRVAVHWFPPLVERQAADTSAQFNLSSFAIGSAAPLQAQITFVVCALNSEACWGHQREFRAGSRVQGVDLSGLLCRPTDQILGLFLPGPTFACLQSDCESPKAELNFRL